jgi:membrane protease YdiL (CAAX protease family)
MGLVLFFLAFNGMLIGGYVHQQWHLARQRHPPPQPRRLADAELRGFAIRQVMIAAVLAYAWHAGYWTAASAGFHGAQHWAGSVLAGEAAFLGLMGAYALVLRATGTLAFMRETATRGNLRVWPRGRAQKWTAALFIMVFNPFTEEIVMRGILIHQWGLVLGSPVAPIIVGLLLNAGLDWYQGWRMQLWHAMFFAMAVCLLYSPFGLTAAITAHVLGDVMPIVTLRRQQKAARRGRHAAPRARRS